MNEQDYKKYAEYYLTLSPLEKVKFLEDNLGLGKLRWYQRIFLAVEFAAKDLIDELENSLKKL